MADRIPRRSLSASHRGSREEPAQEERDPYAVQLLTRHCAKGLEFRGVAIIGCAAGLLPSATDPDSGATLEEERRVFYLGLTRARDELALFRTLKRDGRRSRPSPFRKELSKQLCRELRVRAVVGANGAMER